VPKNTLDDLRNHLFETIEALKDDEKPMDVARANAICNVSRSLIDSAKVELKYLDLVGGETAASFLAKRSEAPALVAPPRKEPRTA